MAFLHIYIVYNSFKYIFRLCPFCKDHSCSCYLFIDNEKIYRFFFISMHLSKAVPAENIGFLAPISMFTSGNFAFTSDMAVKNTLLQNFTTVEQIVFCRKKLFCTYMRNGKQMSHCPIGTGEIEAPSS